MGGATGQDSGNAKPVQQAAIIASHAAKQKIFVSGYAACEEPSRGRFVSRSVSAGVLGFGRYYIAWAESCHFHVYLRSCGTYQCNPITTTSASVYCHSTPRLYF